MNTINSKTIAAALAIFLAVETQGQTDLSKFEFGTNGNIFIYQGDLAPLNTGSYRTLKAGLGFFVNRLINSSFTMRTSLQFGKLNGDDSKFSLPEWRRFRNLKFNSPVTEISELLIWHPLEWRKQERIRNFSPYLFAGFGLSFLKITRDWSAFDASHFSGENLSAGLTEDIQHKPPRVLPAIPAGLGVRYPVSEKLSVFGEAAYRISFTDYLDGFSKAANPKKNDHYYTHSVGLVYQFGKKRKDIDCPVVQN
jgi:hypothetical protein